MNDVPGQLEWNDIEDDLMAAQEFKDKLAEIVKEECKRATRSAERAVYPLGGQR